MQRPKNLDAACMLVLLQEEMVLTIPSQGQKTGDWSSSSRSPSIARLGAPSDKSTLTSGTSTSATASSPDAKLAALRSYRHTMGLCYKCADKWSKDHKCPPKVLSAVETVWDSLLPMRMSPSKLRSNLLRKSVPWPSLKPLPLK
jgi:hypothetical protein